MLRSQNMHILVQTNDVYFAVTMLTLYVADIQTNNSTSYLITQWTQHTVAKKHFHIREPRKESEHPWVLDMVKRWASSSQTVSSNICWVAQVANILHSASVFKSTILCFLLLKINLESRGENKKKKTGLKLETTVESDPVTMTRVPCSFFFFNDSATFYRLHYRRTPDQQ